MASDEVDNDQEGFLEGFESDSIVQRELRSDSESELGARWDRAVPDEGAPGFLAIRNRIEECFSFQPKPWQVSGLLDVKNGLDTVVVAGTGSGKSVLFQGIPIAVKGGIVLVISPTLALMADQVCAH